MKKRNKSLICYIICFSLIVISIYMLYPLLKAEKNSKTLKKETTNNVKFDPMSEYDPLRVDYEKLKHENPDYVCWLHVGNGVSEPVLRGETNKTYLRHDFNKNYSINGSIFLNSFNSKNFNDSHNIIYGHNMRDKKTKFSKNENYLKHKYLKTHPFFYIHFKDCYYTYEIFGVSKCQEDSDIYDSTETNEELLKNISNCSLYDFKISDCIDNDIVSLSCCIGRSGGSDRLILHGKKIRYTTYDNKTTKLTKGMINTDEQT